MGIRKMTQDDVIRAQERRGPVNIDRLYCEGTDPLYKSELTPMQRKIVESAKAVRESGLQGDAKEEAKFAVMLEAHRYNQNAYQELMAEHLREKENYENGKNYARIAYEKERFLDEMGLLDDSEFNNLSASYLADQTGWSPTKIEALAKEAARRNSQDKTLIREVMQKSHYDEPFRADCPDRYAQMEFFNCELGTMIIAAPEGPVLIELENLFK